MLLITIGLRTTRRAKVTIARTIISVEYGLRPTLAYSSLTMLPPPKKSRSQPCK